MLKIENLWGVTGSGLGNLTNLKELHSYRCSILRSENLISLLRSANHLEYLDITECGNVTNTVINVKNTI